LSGNPSGSKAPRGSPTWGSNRKRYFYALDFQQRVSDLSMWRQKLVFVS